MTFIEVNGNITEDGKLDVHVQLPAGTPAGKVSVIVIVEPELDDDDALWDEAFRSTQAELQEMATRVSAARKAGLTKPFDPEVDLDENGDIVSRSASST
jgi:hypothetical protein